MRTLDGRLGSFLWSLLPLAPVAALLVAIARAPLAVCADCAMYLKTAELLLSGKIPYVDFIDVNPPLVTYVSAVPVLVAKLLGAHPIPVFSTLIAGLAALSATSARRQLLALGLGEAAASLLALAWTAPTPWLHASFTLGQREHLFSLAYLPFLLLRIRRRHGVPARRGEAAALGVLAGVGLGLKPYFGFIALLPELWLARGNARRALRGEETVAAALVLLVYAAHFAFVPASMRAAFFGRWLPLFGAKYSVYDALRVHDAIEAALWPALFVAIAFYPRPSLGRAWQDLHGALAGATAGAVVAFVVQQKAFEYQRVPIQLFLTLLVGSLVLERAVHTRGRWGAGVFAAALTAASLAGASDLAGVPGAGADFWRGAVSLLSRPGDRVLFLFTSVPPAYPAITQTSRLPGSRYLWLFPIPMLVCGDARPLAEPPGPAERQFLDELAADVRTHPPAMIAVQTAGGAQGCTGPFSVRDYLDERLHPSLFAGYREIFRDTELFTAFSILVPEPVVRPALPGYIPAP